MPKVYNYYRKDAPADAVYIGRPSMWGNPFEIGKDGTREEVVEKFREWFVNGGYNGSAVDVRELKGKDLLCWCSPRTCHGDVLLELANADETV